MSNWSPGKVAPILAVALACASPHASTSAPSLTSADVKTPRAVTEAESPESAIPIRLPPGATLVDSARVTEVRMFPEEVLAGSSREDEEAEVAVGANTSDASYVSNRPYSAVVEFMDQSLPASSCAVPRRRSLAAGTFWTLRCPNGSLVRVAVRNTSPTTLEVVATKAAAAQEPRP